MCQKDGGYREAAGSWGDIGVVHTVRICVAICFDSGFSVATDTPGQQASSLQCLTVHSIMQRMEDELLFRYLKGITFG